MPCSWITLIKILGSDFWGLLNVDISTLCMEESDKLEARWRHTHEQGLPSRAIGRPQKWKAHERDTLSRHSLGSFFLVLTVLFFSALAFDNNETEALKRLTSFEWKYLTWWLHCSFASVDPALRTKLWLRQIFLTSSVWQLDNHDGYPFVNMYYFGNICFLETWTM